MSKRLIDILPKIPQYEDIPYAGDFVCPECDKSGFFDYDWDRVHRVKPNLVGWTETNIGKMGVFECPVCGSKYRFHCTIGTWMADEDEFEYYLFFKAKRCSNWPELRDKMQLDKNDIDYD